MNKLGHELKNENVMRLSSGLSLDAAAFTEICTAATAEVAATTCTCAQELFELVQSFKTAWQCLRDLAAWMKGIDSKLHEAGVIDAG